jgi:hypothetical protein
VPVCQPRRPASPAGLPFPLACRTCWLASTYDLSAQPTFQPRWPAEPGGLPALLASRISWPAIPAGLPAFLACQPCWPASPAGLPALLVCSTCLLASPSDMPAPMACYTRRTARSAGLRANRPATTPGCQTSRPDSPQPASLPASTLQAWRACQPCWSAEPVGLLACKTCLPASQAGLH